MEGERRLSVVVGFFVIGALALFAAAVLSLTSQRGPWIPRYNLVAYFENGQGLIDGAPVRLAGKDIGIVESVAFAEPGSGKPPVRVKLHIDTSVRERIRADSRATIGTIGLLGDKYVEITMGNQDQPVLADGSEIQTITPSDLFAVLQKGTDALDGVAKLAANVNHVVEQFNEAKGGARVADVAKGASNIIDQVQKGNGLLHSLIYDEYKGKGVESISRSLATIDSVLNEIAHGRGLAHKVIYEDEKQIDPLAKADAAAAHLESILAKIDRGEGTLGLLVSDPSLYNDLKTLLGGANRSALVRSLIRLSTPEDAKEQKSP
jgi:phospholipid/cholesterol/gamma-HCH transport system substrate-binding protein